MRNLNQNNKTELTLPEALSRLRLLDDEMMRTALHDQKELVQYILRIIMQMPELGSLTLVSSNWANFPVNKANRAVKLLCNDLTQPHNQCSIIQSTMRIGGEGMYL